GERGQDRGGFGGLHARLRPGGRAGGGGVGAQGAGPAGDGGAAQGQEGGGGPRPALERLRRAVPSRDARRGAEPAPQPAGHLVEEPPVHDGPPEGGHAAGGVRADGPEDRLQAGGHEGGPVDGGVGGGQDHRRGLPDGGRRGGPGQRVGDRPRRPRGGPAADRAAQGRVALGIDRGLGQEAGADPQQGRPGGPQRPVPVRQRQEIQKLP